MYVCLFLTAEKHDVREANKNDKTNNNKDTLLSLLLLTTLISTTTTQQHSHVNMNSINFHNNINSIN